MAGIFDVVGSTERTGRRENNVRTRSGSDLGDPYDFAVGTIRGRQELVEQPSSSSRVYRHSPSSDFTASSSAGEISLHWRRKAIRPGCYVWSLPPRPERRRIS